MCFSLSAQAFLGNPLHPVDKKTVHHILYVHGATTFVHNNPNDKVSPPYLPSLRSLRDRLENPDGADYSLLHNMHSRKHINQNILLSFLLKDNHLNTYIPFPLYIQVNPRTRE